MATPPMGMPVGRPTDCTPELIEEICIKTAKTSKGLHPLCNENPHWPDYSTIRDWIRNRPEFSDKYARAKLDQASFMAEEINAIADDNSADYAEDENGVMRYNSEHVQRSRLRVDTRKWLASKLAPKVYGERTQSDITVTMAEDRLKDLE